MLDEKIPPFRTQLQKQKSPPAIWAMILIFLFFLSLLILLFLQSPFSKINQITIVGNQLLRDEEILNRMNYQKGVSFFAMNPDQAEKVLQSLPETKQVTVEKGFPNQLRVEIQEYQPIAYLQSASKHFFPLLENGSIVRSRPNSSGTSKNPVAFNWSNREDDLRKVLPKLSQIPKHILNQILYFKPHPTNQDQVVLFTLHQHKIVVRLKQLDVKMKLYPSFEKQPPGTIYLLDSIWFSPEKNEKEQTT